MSNRDLIRLQHILDSAKAIESYVEGKQKEDLENNRMLVQAIIREFEIIGEAAVAVTDQLKQTFTTFPWRQMIGMRNRLIHAYFDIDHDILWNTIEEKIPKLIKDVSNIINSHSF